MCKPEKKDILLLKLLRGETIDVTKDEDLFFHVNKDRVTLEQFTNREKFRADAEDMKWMKKGMYDPKHGKLRNGMSGRWLGDIPAEIYFSRKELSDPNIPKHERLKNIKKFLNEFPVFRAGEKRV